MSLFEGILLTLSSAVLSNFLKYNRPFQSKNYLGFGLKQFYTDYKKYKKVNQAVNCSLAILLT